MRIWKVAVPCLLFFSLLVLGLQLYSRFQQTAVALPQFEDESCCISHTSITLRPASADTHPEKGTFAPVTEGYQVHTWNNDGSYLGNGIADGDKIPVEQAQGARRFPPRVKFAVWNSACDVGTYVNKPPIVTYCDGRSAYSCGELEMSACQVRAWDVAQKVVRFFPSMDDFPSNSQEPMLACTFEDRSMAPPAANSEPPAPSSLFRYNCQFIASGENIASATTSSK